MMTPSRPVRALSEGDRVHLLLPGFDGPIVLSASEAVDLLEQLGALAPVLNEEMARVSDRLGQDHDPIDRASRLPDDGYPRGEDTTAEAADADLALKS